MKEFQIKKLFNDTIPLRESVAKMGIANGGLCVTLAGEKWRLDPGVLANPIRHIIVKNKFGGGEVQINYYKKPHYIPATLPLFYDGQGKLQYDGSDAQLKLG